MLNAQNQAYNTLIVSFSEKQYFFMNHLHSQESQRKGRCFQVFLNVKENKTWIAVPQNAMRNFTATLKTYEKITTKKKKGARKKKKKKKKKRSESHLCTGALLAVSP